MSKVGLYKLSYKNRDLSDGVMEKTNKEAIDYEKDFENWLENSPHVLFDDDSSTVMWIGRQVTASNEQCHRYPDLIGIDSNGDLIVVELKKGKTPRDVVAQILEYASWAFKLTYQELNTMAIKYYENDEQFSDKDLIDIFNTIFYPDNDEKVEVKFNTSQRLFIVAEEISATVQEVVRYLNQTAKIDISCLEYEVYRAGDGEFFISTERIEGYGGGSNRTRAVNVNTNRWNEGIKVKDVIKEVVMKVTKGNKDVTFSPKEIIDLVLQKYPDFNKSTARCQLIQDCVNHTSRKHYKGGQQDLYYLIDKGTYRLYNAETDGKWNWEGKQVDMTTK